jgi:hypothetical protein
MHASSAQAPTQKGVHNHFLQRKHYLVSLSFTAKLQEWGKVPTANAYADGQMSVPSA